MGDHFHFLKTTHKGDIVFFVRVSLRKWLQREIKSKIDRTVRFPFPAILHSELLRTTFGIKFYRKFTNKRLHVFDLVWVLSCFLTFKVKMSSENAQVLLAVEAESYVEHLRSFKISEVGNYEWVKCVAMINNPHLLEYSRFNSKLFKLLSWVLLFPLQFMYSCVYILNIYMYFIALDK